VQLLGRLKGIKCTLNNTLTNYLSIHTLEIQEDDPSNNDSLLSPMGKVWSAWTSRAHVRISPPHVSNEKMVGCLGVYRGCVPTQLYRDFNELWVITRIPVFLEVDKYYNRIMIWFVINYWRDYNKQAEFPWNVSNCFEQFVNSEVSGISQVLEELCQRVRPWEWIPKNIELWQSRRWRKLVKGFQVSNTRWWHVKDVWNVYPYLGKKFDSYFFRWVETTN